MTKPRFDVETLGFPWSTEDPFLFCVHHDDAYPAGNDEMGPKASLAGRNLGQDFVIKDGFRMYHGERVPGFPPHPHRGFETITVVRNGFIDHSDSLGATARFGAGDVQWMTAGRGIVHSEMFPLRDRDNPNPLELFQIWLNLPAKNKMVDPHFSMLWNDTVPVLSVPDEAGVATEVRVIAGTFGTTAAPSPPPKSWASSAEASVAIWAIRIPRGGTFVLPKAPAGVNRNLYFFRGKNSRVDDLSLRVGNRVGLRTDEAIRVSATDEDAEFLYLQGRPIGEPVVQYGPFVMNSAAEIQQAFLDYRRTQFGGWPWPSDEPVHPREEGRFAVHADGKRETRGT